MEPISPFDYAADGAWILCSDGPELLVHGGADEAPLWSDTLPADLVGVAACPAHILALDRAGTLRAYPVDRTVPQTTRPACVEIADGRIGTHARALAAAGRVQVALVLADEGLYRLPWLEQPKRLTGLTGTCLAVNPDGTKAAVGLEEGELVLIQADTGLIDARLELGAEVRAAVWLPEGRWLVAAGSGLQEVSPIGEKVGTPLDVAPAGDDPDALALSRDGALVAWRAGAHRVAVAHRRMRRLAAEITWEREVGRVAFGPDRLLGIGLAGGDGNKIDLRTGDVYRTDTFGHRTHNSWVLMPGINTDMCSAPGGTAHAAETGTGPPGKLKQALLALAILAGLVLAAWAILTLSEHEEDQGRNQEMQRDIRDSIQRSLHRSGGG